MCVCELKWKVEIASNSDSVCACEVCVSQCIVWLAASASDTKVCGVHALCEKQQTKIGCEKHRK